MGGFSVSETGLTAFAAQLRRAGDDLTKTLDHLNKANYDAFQGLLVPVCDRAKEAAALQTGAVLQAARLCSGDADAIGQAASYYRHTDQRQAATFDATCPPVGAPTVTGDDRTHRPYTDPMVPSGRLNEPPSYAEEMSWKLSLDNDLVSVSSIVRWVIQQVFGVDPLQIIGDSLLGDWCEIRRIADRFNNAAWACGDVADNLRSGVADAQHDWTGNAANDALSWVDDLQKALDSCKETNEYLAENYKNLAEGYFDMFKVLSAQVTDWLDKLAAAAAAASAAGLAEEIPVADVFLDVNAGMKIWNAVRDGTEIYEKAKRIKDGIEAFGAAIDIGSGAFHDMIMSASPMPNAPWTSTVPAS